MLLLNKQATEHGWDSYLSHVATPLLLQAGALDLGQTARLQRRFRAHRWGPGRTKGETSTPNACFHRIPTFQPILARRVVMRTDTCLPADFYFSTQTDPISISYWLMMICCAWPSTEKRQSSSCATSAIATSPKVSFRARRTF
jgi:hypothetical protein